jgi:hypothetical protein
LAIAHGTVWSFSPSRISSGPDRGSVTPTAIGAAYDPASDAWRQLPDSDIDPNANTASWLEDRLIAWDYSEHTSAYSPDTDAWASLGGPPVDACEDVPTSVTAGGFLFGRLCGELVVMLPGEDRWHNVTRRDLQFWTAAFAPAEDLVFVLGYEGVGSDAATRMFAFRPPGSFACGGFSGVRGEELAGAVAARFELLRSDRPEALARPEIEDLLSPAGEAAFIDPASGWAGCSPPTSRSIGSCQSNRSRAELSGSWCASTTSAAPGSSGRSSSFGPERTSPATTARLVDDASAIGR